MLKKGGEFTNGWKSLVQCFMFSGVKEGYLVEARLCVEERDLVRGVVWSYCYGVHQRDKEIWGMAMSRVQIPLNPSIKGKEIYHLY